MIQFKNGREAKQGDRVLHLASGRTGIIYKISIYNARLVETSEKDACVNVTECLHIDDIEKADIPDSSKEAYNALAI